MPINYPERTIMKRLMLVSLLATLLGGCVIVPWGYDHRYEGHYRDGGQQRWHDHDRWSGGYDHWDHGR